MRGHGMMLERRWLARTLAALVSFAAALVTTVVLPAQFKARADGDSLQFNGFVHLSDLTCGDKCAVTSINKSIGVDTTLGQVIYWTNTPTRGLVSMDTTSLQQTSFIPTGSVVVQSGAVDSATNRVFLGSFPVSSVVVDCSTVGIACSTPAGPSAAQIESVDLTTHKTSVFTLPSTYDGYSVISLTVAHPTPDRTMLFALVFRDDLAHQGQLNSTLTLLALDGDELDDTNAAAASKALLWSYSLSSCGETPSYAISTGGQVPEFLGVDPDGRFAYFACRGLDEAGGQVTPPGAMVVDFPDAYPAGPSTTGFTTTFYPYGADVRQAISGGDQVHGQLFIASLGALDKLYVFDAKHRAWTGSVPFPSSADANIWGIPSDSATGRVYVVQEANSVFGIQANQVPAPQGGALGLGDLRTVVANGPIVDPTTHRLFIAVTGQFTHDDGSNYPRDDSIAVYTDSRPAVDTSNADDPDAQTHDIAPSADTPVTYGAFASAYGAKAIAVGGLHSTPLGQTQQIGGGTPAGTAGFVCQVKTALEQAGGQDSGVPCLSLPTTSDGNRSITFGQVGDTEVSNSATKSSASQLSVDQGSTADSSAITSYNAADDLWGQFVSSDGTPPSQTAGPVFDPANQGVSQGESQFEQQSAPATCADYSGNKEDKTTPGAHCISDGADQQASGAAVSPDIAATSPIQVGYAGSATSVAYGADNTAVTSAMAVARDISLDIPSGPSVSIGEVTATASSTAAGRPGTANSAFARTISDVVVRDPSGKEVFSCGFSDTQCDPRTLTTVVSSLSPSPVEFLTPQRDTTATTAGSPGGAQAEVIKDNYAYWNDYNTIADDGFEVPALQIIMVGDTAQPSRVVMELAGVHVESHDAIGLPPPPAPQLPDPTLKLSLTDGSTPAVPLAGGEFSLVADDGTTAATCSTGADGIGSCSFPDVKPGSYTIKETKAPPGYALAPDYQLSLDPGQDYTATFVNLLAIGAVHVSLTSAVDKKPLSGAIFAMYAGASTLGTPLATCTTAKDGTCGFKKVPLASYTMHQQSAPKGFLAAKDFPFDLTDPGQDATLNFVDGTPAVKAQPGKFIPGKPAVPPHTEVVGGGGIPAVPAAYSTGTSNIPPVLSSAPSDQAPLVAGLPQRLADLPAQLAKLLTHSPQQAVLLLFMWLVFGLPIYLWARRRQLLTATEGT